MTHTTIYAVRLANLNSDQWETILAGVSESEAVAFAATYNAIETGKAACVVSYPVGSDPRSAAATGRRDAQQPENDPSEAEIRQRMLEIQANWDEATRFKRFLRLEADADNSRRWMPPVVDERFLVAHDAD